MTVLGDAVCVSAATVLVFKRTHSSSVNQSWSSDAEPEGHTR